MASPPQPGSWSVRGAAACALAAVALLAAGCTRAPGERAGRGAPSADAGARAPLPAAGAGCRACHAVRGLEEAHAALGCEACHLGRPDAGAADEAHAGLVPVPGNFADMDRTCGTSACHPDVPWRLRENIMATLRGVVAVDRWVFGEQPRPSGDAGVDALGRTPADTHLRNLCASCHLGNPKDDYGPVGERSRGGGCSACHLRYDAPALAALERLQRAPDGGRGAALADFEHPALSSRVPDERCFGCHARSGRISLNFLGLADGVLDGGAPARVLEDGRALAAAPADVHGERGLGCTDCHGSWEVMGRGAPVQHREEQALVQCTDCHGPAPEARATFDALDPESQRSARRAGLAGAGGPWVTMARAPFAVLGAREGDGGLVFRGRFSGQEHPLRAPTPACRGAHARVGCPACHDAWAPQCVGCHTRFDARDVMFDLKDRVEAPGAWHEESGPVFAEPGALGVRELPDGGVRFEPFVPGMVLTIDRGDGGTTFRRLYAPLAAHTTRREARACAGCHADPLALGWGRGVLRFEGGRALAVRFEPRFPRRAEDGLPQDAWIPMLRTRGRDATTREDTRPLTVAEQRRVLTVGACLTCHAPDAPWLQRSLAGAGGLPAPRARCRTPAWAR